jgi:hypothetical protein
VDARLTRVSGHAERLAALELIASFADRPVAVTLEWIERSERPHREGSARAQIR